MKQMITRHLPRRSHRASFFAACLMVMLAARVHAENAAAAAQDPAEGQKEAMQADGEKDAIPADAQKEADAIWQSRCSTCHGAAGKGDGAAAAALTPKPRDFSSASWQASVTDEHIEKIIAEGGQSVGLSMLMPANPDLVSKPAVIKALRAHVRGLAAPH